MNEESLRASVNAQASYGLNKRALSLRAQAATKKDFFAIYFVSALDR
jgi:hypothetical protein